MEDERIIRSDEGGLGVRDLDPFFPAVVPGIDRFEALEEGAARNGILKAVQIRPVRRDAELGQDKFGAEAGLRWRRQGLFAFAREEISCD